MIKNGEIARIFSLVRLYYFSLRFLNASKATPERAIIDTIEAAAIEPPQPPPLGAGSALLVDVGVDVSGVTEGSTMVTMNPTVPPEVVNMKFIRPVPNEARPSACIVKVVPSIS